MLSTRTLTTVTLIISLSACGTLTKPLTNGTATYTNPLRTADQTATGHTEQFKTEATGCFANSESATETEVIAPAIQKTLTASKAIKAENVKASRQIAPTVLDSITGAFIWSCSYWDVSGTLIF